MKEVVEGEEWQDCVIIVKQYIKCLPEYTKLWWIHYVTVVDTIIHVGCRCLLVTVPPHGNAND